MIGYYAHHVGAGHVRRAVALAEVLAARGTPVTVLSSAPAPASYGGPWVALERDDAAVSWVSRDRDANGRLHHVPLGEPGLRARMARIVRWVETHGPDLLVSDVSVEVTLQARLLGVPVVSVVLPGRRDDAAHDLGFSVSAALVGFWPDDGVARVHGLSTAQASRLRPLGALATRPPAASSAGEPGRVLVLGGRGGSGWTSSDLLRAQRESALWRWHVLGPDTWVEDPSVELARAEVVLTHAGEGALADVAAARRPAVVIAAPRPHDEQAATVRALRSGAWPAVVVDSLDSVDWGEVLGRASRLNPAGWVDWVDGGAGARFADVIDEARGRPVVEESA